MKNMVNVRRMRTKDIIEETFGSKAVQKANQMTKRCSKN